MQDDNSSIALQPNIAEAWYDRVTTLANLEQYDRDIADLSEAIRLKLDVALAYCNRGASKFSTGQFDEAFDDFAADIDLLVTDRQSAMPPLQPNASGSENDKAAQTLV
jgi:tetratricopeptide (TPR) repeat protein